MSVPKTNYRIVSRGPAVRDARIRKNYTPKRFAQLAEISRATLSMIENGHGTSVTTAHRVAELVNEPFEELFEIIEKRSGDGDRAR